MSWRYGQAAREAQRIAGYWRGDEEIELHHLHPEHRVVRCRLPGLRPRVFLHERERPHGPLRELGLVLDTIAIDAGGVATGPLANSFLLALAFGVSATMGERDPLVDGLGLVALVALAPVVSVMTMGVLVRWKERRKER